MHFLWFRLWIRLIQKTVHFTRNTWWLWTKFILGLIRLSKSEPVMCNFFFFCIVSFVSWLKYQSIISQKLPLKKLIATLVEKFISFCENHKDTDTNGSIWLQTYGHVWICGRFLLFAIPSCISFHYSFTSDVENAVQFIKK